MIRTEASSNVVSTGQKTITNDVRFVNGFGSGVGERPPTARRQSEGAPRPQQLQPRRQRPFVLTNAEPVAVDSASEQTGRADQPPEREETFKRSFMTSSSAERYCSPPATLPNHSELRPADGDNGEDNNNERYVS